MPGYLVPADLGRMIPLECNRCHRVMRDTTACDGACECGGLIHVCDPRTWAESNLLASPGALVLQGGKPFRIHTLVPARQESGACIHFTDEGSCAIHLVAPFGCAFFGCDDYTAGKMMANHAALEDIYRAQLDRASLYCTIWEHLWSLGKRTPAPEVARALMKKGDGHERVSLR
jgi:hypothetical protein